MSQQTAPFSSQQARHEAERCLQCFDAPCVAQCPVHIPIPTFIAMIRSGNVRGAAEQIKSANAMANTCGKVCPEEIFCQSVCTRGKEDAPIRIRELHFFATQQEAREGFSPITSQSRKRKKVAVVGGGPAGLSCAFELAKLGYPVTLFDGRTPGGVPKNSIPPFRLSDEIVSDDVRFLSEYITVKQECITAESFAGLRESFDAVFLGIGLGRDRALGLAGEHTEGIYTALQFLEAVKMRGEAVAVGKKVVIVGGGNVSLDAASVAKHLGASEVLFLYRRTAHEMKVWKTELEEARSRGVEFRFLTTPVGIMGSTSVSGLRCRRMTLTDRIDSSGRPVPVEVEGSDFVINADTVVIAIGQAIGADLVQGLERTPGGYLRVGPDYRTSMEGVYAGGDAISGEGTIVQAVAHGKEAAWAIHASLSPARRTAGQSRQHHDTLA